MRIGIFADTHDHLEHIRRAVTIFNDLSCACVLFAGDLVSTFAVPPLRKLRCPLVGCYGDNEGNKVGLQSGLRIIGRVEEPPVSYAAADGTRFIIAHMQRQLAGYPGEFDVAVYGHTHRPRIWRDERRRLWINPGEASGWTFGRPTVAIVETAGMAARLVDLCTADGTGRVGDAPRPARRPE